MPQPQIIQYTFVGKYVIICATYELSGINHVTRNAVQFTMQPDYIIWVGHWPKTRMTAKLSGNGKFMWSCKTTQN